MSLEVTVDSYSKPFPWLQQQQQGYQRQDYRKENSVRNASAGNAYSARAEHSYETERPDGADSALQGHLSHGYVDHQNGKNYIFGSEEHGYQSRDFENIVKEYLNSEQGLSFVDYAGEKAKNPIHLVGLGSAHLDDYLVAAVMHDGEKGIMVGNYGGNKDFQSRVNDFAELYGLSEDAALEYVINHELAHVAGYATEASAEGFLKAYFTQKAEESKGEMKETYQQLAEVAEAREAEAYKRDN